MNWTLKTGCMLSLLTVVILTLGGCGPRGDVALEMLKGKANAAEKAMADRPPIPDAEKVTQPVEEDHVEKA